MVECTHTVPQGSNEMALPIYQMTALTVQRKQEIVKEFPGISLVVPWLRLCASTAGGVGSIPGLRTKILHATHAKI